MADIHEYSFKMSYLPIILINFSWAKSHNFFQNGKIKIHLAIQHLLKLANLQYSHLSNKRGAWNKRGGVPEMENHQMWRG